MADRQELLKRLEVMKQGGEREPSNVGLESGGSVRASRFGRGCQLCLSRYFVEWSATGKHALGRLFKALEHIRSG